MTLNERIKEQRKNAGLSQEKTAELVGVSRQAVTKWETGQSAPSTENLFKLAEIFGTTVDLLLSDEEKTNFSAEEIDNLDKPEEANCAEETRVVWEKRVQICILIIGGYLLIDLLGRFFGTREGDYTVMGWLFGTSPSQLPYLLGWLLHQKLFWIAMGISALPALLGKFRFAFVTLGGFALSLLIGEFFGKNPEGEAIGQGHYGWLIWGILFLISIIVGIILEKTEIFCKKTEENN